MEPRTCVYCGELTRPGLFCNSCGRFAYAKWLVWVPLTLAVIAVVAVLAAFMSQQPARQAELSPDAAVAAISLSSSVTPSAAATSTPTAQLVVTPSLTLPSVTAQLATPTATSVPTLTPTPEPPTATPEPPTPTDSLPTATPMITNTGFVGHLVFAHQYESGTPGKWRIESIDMASKQRQSLRGSGTNNDVNPVWSPDGQTIAFATEVNNNRDIWLMNADGSDAYRLTKSPVKQQYAAWSADGTAVVFTYNRSKTTAGLYRMDLDGSDGRDLGEGGNASWSRHNTIIFSLGEPYSHDVWSMDSNGSNRSNITNTPNINEEFAIWSPDGTQIAFVANPVTSNSAGDLERRQIWIMNADGSNRRQLTSGSATSTNPTWSPDGRSIAFVSRRGNSSWQVWVMTADGSNQTQLTSDEGRKFYVSWGGHN